MAVVRRSAPPSREVETQQTERAEPLTGQALIDETLKESFPASDPPSWTLGNGGAAQPMEVVVEGMTTTFAQQVTVGRHRLLVDEPAASGGTDTGPGPYDLLLAALGACTSMTLGLYARRKRLPLQAVRVRLRHAKIYAEDCANCETKGGRLDRIERDLELVGDLDDDQRARLLDIANKCPIHRSLQEEIEIATRLV